LPADKVTVTVNGFPFIMNCCMPFYHNLGFLKSFSRKY
jgi:hypothetical protein